MRLWILPFMCCYTAYLSLVNISKKKTFIFVQIKLWTPKTSECTNLTGVCSGRGKYIFGKTNARYGVRSVPPGSTHFTFQIRDTVFAMCKHDKQDHSSYSTLDLSLVPSLVTLLYLLSKWVLRLLHLRNKIWAAWFHTFYIPNPRYRLVMCKNDKTILPALDLSLILPHCIRFLHAVFLHLLKWVLVLLQSKICAAWFHTFHIPNARSHFLIYKHNKTILAPFDLRNKQKRMCEDI